MTPQRLRELSLARLDLLCAFVYYDPGSTSLKYATILMAGYSSVALPYRTQLANLRRCLRGLTTIEALRSEVEKYNASEGINGTASSGHFQIDGQTLEFEPAFDLPSKQIRDALAELAVAPSPALHGKQFADDGAELHLTGIDGAGGRFVIDGLPRALPRPQQHNRERESRAPVTVLWSALMEEAQAMDAIDLEQRVERPGNWAGRLRACVLESLSKNGGFVGEPCITLEGLRHLIGMPGSGKTTLLLCLLRHLSRKSIKTAVFFPSIHVCRQYLEDLRRYGACAGILVGQSPATKRTHSIKLAESLASNDVLRGFARSAPSASLFEGTCALVRMTTAPADSINVETQMCDSVMQKLAKPGSADKFERRMCPAWAICPKNTAPGELPSVPVWLGHVLSADTRIAAETTPFSQRYFELIAETFDVVIFDEADSAQQALDMSGISQMRLSGYAGSFHQMVQQASLRPLADGMNARLRNDPDRAFSLETNEFERLNIFLLSAIHMLDDDTRKRMASQFLVPGHIIGNWLAVGKRRLGTAEGLAADAMARWRHALVTTWEEAAIDAFDSKPSDLAQRLESPRVAKNAAWLGLSIYTLAAKAQSLRARLDEMLSLRATRNSPRREAEIVDEIARIFAVCMGCEERDIAKPVVRLLIAVTFTILSFRRLATRFDAMSGDGAPRHSSDESRCSDELLLSCPENLLRSMSGVRFITKTQVSSVGDQGSDIQVQYIIFSGTPRALMYRMHEWTTGTSGEKEGPAVLHCSGTSYFPQSPAFHVDVEPTYLLSAHETTRPAPSRYVFRPILDRERNDGSYVQFSGTQSNDERNAKLRKMVNSLLSGKTGESTVEIDCEDFDVRCGVRRKAAFVVNSYEQCHQIKLYIDQSLSGWRDRSIAVVDKIPDFATDRGYVTTDMVESLGDSDAWEVLIFPIGAIGRGVNIVFSNGPRQRDATIGTLYFLTRPHPPPEDLSFLISLGASATMAFDRANPVQSGDIEAASLRMQHARRKLYKRVGRLLRGPVAASTLDELLRPFTANIAVQMMQTIGRAMRNGCPAQSFFVDNAWARRSSAGEPDTASSSMLVQMREILEDGANATDPAQAYLFRRLYQPFIDGLRNIEGLMGQTVTVSVADMDDDDWGSPLEQADGHIDEQS